MDTFETAAECVPNALSELLAGRPDYADVFLHSISQEVVEARSLLRGSQFGPPSRMSRRTRIEGIALRTITGSTIQHSAMHDLTPQAIGDFSSKMVLRANAGTNTGANIELDEKPHVETSTWESADSELRERLESLADAILDVALTAHPQVEAARVHVAAIGVRRAIASPATGGEAIRDRSQRTEIHVSLSIGERDVTIIRTHRMPHSDPQELIRSIGMDLAERTLRCARAETSKELRSGRPLKVILPPGWGGVWLHEAIGHQLEADMLHSGKSALTKKFNQMVGPEFLTIVDSPLLPGGRVRQTVDDEGTPSTEVVLIENGRLARTLTDRYSALRFGLAPTGNGRRGHYAQAPKPRMTNLILKAGAVPASDLKAEVDHGIEVLDIDHAWFEPGSGRVFLHVIESNLIEHGSTAAMLAPCILGATPEELLSSIIGIGSDFKLDSDRGYCVKGGAALPVGVGQPTVLMAGLDVVPAS